MTAAALAVALEVSQRTIYRDVEALSEAGVPIHAERGATGGIVLADGYRRALAAFSEDELQALFAAAESPLHDLGVAALPTALQKLAGALPEPQRRVAQANRDRLLIDHNRWGRDAPNVEVLQRLRTAVADAFSVSIDYRDRTGSVSTRSVDPLGLIAKAGIWYLVATDRDKGERTFRVDRMTALRETRLRFNRPSGFDLDRHWRASVASLERRDEVGYVVTFRTRRELLATFSGFWRFEQLAEDATTVTVRVTFASEALAAAQFIVHGSAFELIEPRPLRTAIVARATAALEIFGGPSYQPSET